MTRKTIQQQMNMSLMPQVTTQIASKAAVTEIMTLGNPMTITVTMRSHSTSTTTVNTSTVIVMAVTTRKGT